MKYLLILKIFVKDYIFILSDPTFLDPFDKTNENVILQAFIQNKTVFISFKKVLNCIFSRFNFLGFTGLGLGPKIFCKNHFLGEILKTVVFIAYIKD